MDEIAELFREVGAGNRAAVETMLRYKPQLARAHDASSLSILQFARYMRQVEIIELLIDTGPALDVFEAAALDRADHVRDLLALDRSLATAFDAAGATALHGAASFGAVEAIAALLAAGARIEAATRAVLASKPLHAAASGGHLEACRLLLRHGADPNARRQGGFTPLMIAASSNDRGIVELLVARNVNIDLRNDDGRTAVQLARAAGHRELAARLRLDERVIDRRTV